MAEDPKVLEIVESIDRKLDEKIRGDESRFARLEQASEATKEHVFRIEESTGEDRKALRDLADQVSRNTKQISEIAEAQTSVAKSAAAAAEIAAQALRSANTSQDDIAKMVGSAMAIQNESLRKTVNSSVSSAVEPLTKKAEDLGKKVDDLEANDGKQNRVDEAICIELGLNYEAVATPSDSSALKPGLAKPKTTLAKLARENKIGTVAAAFTFGTVVVQLILKILGAH